ncbi:MAG: hypothetical protein ACRCWF_12965 [Beijerinckiaceae bacterium]
MPTQSWSNIRRAAFIVVACLALAGYTQRASEAQTKADAAARSIQLADASKLTRDQARAAIHNRTTLSLSSSHGPQISFKAPDGKIYLWYPGNRMILQGEWQLEIRRIRNNTTGQEIELAAYCYRYGANTYNPATGSRGAQWECASAAQSLARTTESAEGDIFGLAGRSAPPFVLTRDDETFEKVRAKLRPAS